MAGSDKGTRRVWERGFWPYQPSFLSTIADRSLLNQKECHYIERLPDIGLLRFLIEADGTPTVQNGVWRRPAANVFVWYIEIINKSMPLVCFVYIVLILPTGVQDKRD